MKIEPTSFNPLELILNYLKPISGQYLTLEVLNHIKAYLELGGVTCDNNHEVVSCMAIMEELGLIKTVEHRENNTTYYEVYTTYGK